MSESQKPNPEVQPKPTRRRLHQSAHIGGKSTVNSSPKLFQSP